MFKKKFLSSFLLVALCVTGVGPGISAGATDTEGSLPLSPGALYNRARQALLEGRTLGAIRDLQALEQSRPKDAELQYWLGAAYWSREDGGKAAVAYRKAVAIDPLELSDWSLFALENLAEVYTRTGDLKQSRQAYEAARKREIRPEWLRKIDDQLAELDLAEGIYEVDSATRFNGRGEIVGGIGPSRMRTNRFFELARHTNDPRLEARYYRLAVDTDPGMYQAPFNLGLALVHLGRYREAIPWLERSEEVWKQDGEQNPAANGKADAQAFLALCYLETGRTQKAREHAQRAIELDPADFWANLYHLRSQVATGTAREGLSGLRHLAGQNPEHAETLYALAEAHAALGHPSLAERWRKKAIEGIPVDHPWLNRWKKALKSPLTGRER